MMFRRLLLALIFPALATIACGSAARSTPTPAPTQAAPVERVSFIDARELDGEDEGAVRGGDDEESTEDDDEEAPATACTPRSDWPLYYVVSGDTLGVLAQRTGTTTSALAQANCLSNPNALNVGQALRVPRTPIAVLPPTAIPGNQCPAHPGGILDDLLTLTPSLANNGWCYGVRANQPVTISYPGAPSTFAEVTFYRYNESLPRPDVIGVDTYNGDGAAITWTPHDTMPTSMIYAFAAVPGNPNTTLESDPIYVYVQP